jgi:hypothetical protein
VAPTTVAAAAVVRENLKVRSVRFSSVNWNISKREAANQRPW